MVLSNELKSGQTEDHPTRRGSIEICLVSSLGTPYNETIMIAESVNGFVIFSMNDLILQIDGA